MAIKPQDLALSPAELEEADRIEREIDGKLQRKFIVGTKEIVVEIGIVGTRVKNELARRYKEAGWSKVEECISGRSFTFKM